MGNVGGWALGGVVAGGVRKVVGQVGWGGGTHHRNAATVTHCHACLSLNVACPAVTENERHALNRKRQHDI